MTTPSMSKAILDAPPSHTTTVFSNQTALQTTHLLTTETGASPAEITQTRSR